MHLNFDRPGLRAATLGTLASACLLFCGCSQNRPFGNLGHAATTPPPPAAAAPAPSTPTAAPYVLKAESAGPYIAFSVYNLGTTDLAVKKEDFALITPDSSHQIVPYNKHNVVIDMPENATIKPNGQLSGRAMFNEVSDPIGKRLVFKPDAIGTYADVQPPQRAAEAKGR